MYVFAILVALLQTPERTPDTARGRRIFEAQCALCHGQFGGGGRGPSLARPTLKHAAGDKALREVIANGLPGTEMPASWQISPAEVADVAAYVRSLGAQPAEALPGDAARGRQLYAAQACGTCHIVAGEGSGYGPELTAVGARRSAAYLRDAVVKPAAAAPEGFLMVEVVTASGRRVRGVRVNEDSFTLQLKDLEQKFHTFRKSALRKITRLPSETPMPAYDKLSPAELDDLVAYLASLRGAS
jgi:putative heme-binding domain-containing protein